MQSPEKPKPIARENTPEGLAHDLNNILAANLMHLSVVRQSFHVPQVMTESLNEMEAETRRAVKLVRKLLDSTKPKTDAVMAERDEQDSAPANGLESVKGGSETILLVEDETGLRRMMALRLRKLGYAVLEASQSIEAAAQWDQSQGKIDLLLTDMAMPEGLNGHDLAQDMRSKKASLKIILLSGHENPPPSSTGSDEGIIYLHKPCESAYLEKMVRTSLDSIHAKA
jgi:CheY-like chemotaxis protein